MTAPEHDPIDAVVQEDLRDLFTLESALGHGPGSVVYLAHDLEYNHPVAVKVIPRAAGDGPAVEQAFHRAAAVAAGLEHPRIVPLYSAGATDRIFWWSMPCVQGQSLAEELRDGTAIELDRCLELAHEIADALDFAHRLGVTHADLTPANVLVDVDGHVHVTDFWLPWTLTQAGAQSPGEADSLSAAYLSPEQRLRREAGPAGDQYALATMIYACLTGAPPPVEDAMAAIAGGRSPAPPARLGEMRSDIPAGVSTAVERAMSRSPDGRYATALDFVVALKRTATPVPSGAALRLTGYEALDHRAQGANWRWVPAGVLTLVALGAVVAPWLLSSRSPSTSTASPEAPSVARASVDSLSLMTAAPSPRPRPDTGAPRPNAPSPPVATDVTPRPKSAPPPARPPRVSRPAPAAPARDAVADRATPGRLFVNATPWGQVYVDDDVVGNTPQIGLPVTPGAHRLRVVRDGFEPYEVAILVAPGQELRFTDIVLHETKP